VDPKTVSQKEVLKIRKIKAMGVTHRKAHLASTAETIDEQGGFPFDNIFVIGGCKICG